MVDFGDRLRKLRKERKLTQKELATLIGVKNSVISFYEVGDRTPSLEALIKLSTYTLGYENETIDISGLSEKDKQYIQSLVERLRNK